MVQTSSIALFATVALYAAYPALATVIPKTAASVSKTPAKVPAAASDPTEEQLFKQLYSDIEGQSTQPGAKNTKPVQKLDDKPKPGAVNKPLEGKPKPVNVNKPLVGKPKPAVVDKTSPKPAKKPLNGKPLTGKLADNRLENGHERLTGSGRLPEDHLRFGSDRAPIRPGNARLGEGRIRPSELSGSGRLESGRQGRLGEHEAGREGERFRQGPEFDRQRVGGGVRPQGRLGEGRLEPGYEGARFRQGEGDRFRQGSQFDRQRVGSSGRLEESRRPQGRLGEQDRFENEGTQGLSGQGRFDRLRTPESRLGQQDRFEAGRAGDRFLQGSDRVNTRPQGDRASEGRPRPATLPATPGSKPVGQKLLSKPATTKPSAAQEQQFNQFEETLKKDFESGEFPRDFEDLEYDARDFDDEVWVRDDNNSENNARDFEEEGAQWVRGYDNSENDVIDEEEFTREYEGLEDLD